MSRRSYRGFEIDVKVFPLRDEPGWSSQACVERHEGESIRTWKLASPGACLEESAAMERAFEQARLFIDTLAEGR